MHIQAIHVKNFRNLDEAWIEFSARRNWFVGPNGSGKTNLIEALFYFVRASSFRTRHLADLVQKGGSAASIEIFFTKYGVEQNLKVVIQENGKLLFHNQTPYKTAVDLLGILQGVLIRQDDMHLMSEGPQNRRSFMDLQLIQSSPLYVHHFLRYQRALKQRNFCLKTKQLQGIEAFEAEMARSALYIWQERVKLVEELRPLIQNYFYTLASHESFSIEYSPFSGNYVELLSKNRLAELRLGFTKEGPHRDDLHFTINGLPAKTFGSEGQKRCAVISLKLAEFLYLIPGLQK